MAQCLKASAHVIAAVALAGAAAITTFVAIAAPSIMIQGVRSVRDLVYVVSVFVVFAAAARFLWIGAARVMRRSVDIASRGR